MAEYIERESLLEDIENTLVFSGRPDRQNPKQVGARLVVQRVRCAPAADVAPVVHGRWIPEYEIKEMYYSPDDIERYKVPNGFSCSVCTKWSSARTNYCPNCGARMEGE